jgi:hypothetical protein
VDFVSKLEKAKLRRVGGRKRSFPDTIEVIEDTVFGSGIYIGKIN